MFSFFSPDANKDEKDANAVVTPETIKARRALARALMEKGTDTSPVQHWLQGAARMGNALQGAVEDYYTTRDEKSGQSSGKIDWTGALGGGSAQPQPTPLPAPTYPGSASFPQSLITTESGGNYQAQNNAVGAGGMAGHFGRLQFGQARLQDAMNAGAIPQGVTPAAFMASPELQQKAEKWHFGDIDNFIKANGLDRHIGKNMDGTPVTIDGMRAVAHLGGTQGLKKFLESGGEYDPADANGTHLSDYLEKHAGKSAAAPAAPQTQVAQSSGMNPQLFMLAQKALNNPWTSAGDKAIAQGIVQKYLTQEAKDPRDGVLKDLDIATKRKSLGQVEMETIERNGITYERQKGSNGDYKQVKSLPEKRDENTSDQKELNQINIERARSGLPLMRLDEWKLQKGKASAPAVNIDQKQESEFGKETGKALAKRFDSLATEGDEASQNYQHIGELRRLGKNIDFGATASVRATLGRLGIKTEGVSDIEAFNTLINRLTPQQRLPGSGATSDFDAKMFKQSLPQLMNTPQGNAMIMDTLEKVSQNRMARGDIAMRVQMGELTPKEAMGEIRKLQQEARALSDQLSKPKNETSGGASNAPAVGTMKGGYRFKGGNPADQNSWEQVR